MCHSVPLSLLFTVSERPHLGHPVLQGSAQRLTEAASSFPDKTSSPAPGLLRAHSASLPGRSHVCSSGWNTFCTGSSHLRPMCS